MRLSEILGSQNLSIYCGKLSCAYYIDEPLWKLPPPQFVRNAPTPKKKIGILCVLEIRFFFFSQIWHKIFVF